MIEAEFTYFDAAVIGIMMLSCLFAFFRGFVKEVLSLGAWIGAGIITLYFFSDVAEILKPKFKNDMVAGGLAALGLYISCLLVFSLFNGMIMRMMKEGGDIGLLDNMLGLMFGAFRGGFILSLAYLLMMTVMTEETAPDWLKTAHTRSYVEKGAIILGKAAPEYIVELTSLKDRIIKNRGEVDTEVDLGNANSTDSVEIQRQDNNDLNQFIEGLKRD